MPDPRWLDVLHAMQTGLNHLSRGVEIAETFEFAGDGLDAYRNRMAFMHAMQAGYSSLESGLMRILKLFDEPLPVGDQWHADLVRRAAMPIEGLRPAIYDRATRIDLDELRRFRHVAAHAYDTFEISAATPTREAAQRLVQRLPDCLRAFEARMVETDSPDDRPNDPF